MTTVITLIFQGSNLIHFRGREFVFVYVKETTACLRWSLRNWMALHSKVPERFRLCTRNWKGGEDFWKTEAWREWREYVETKNGQAPSSNSEPKEEKDHLIGNGQSIFRDSEICIERKAAFCPELNYSWLQSKLSKTLWHLSVLCWKWFGCVDHVLGEVRERKE